MAYPEFNQAVRRLAQYRPFDEGGRDVQAAVTDLLLAASAVEGRGFASLKAAQDGIRGLWGMEVELDELRDVVDALDADGRIRRTNGGFELTDHALSTLAKTAEENEAVERQAFSEWELTIRTRQPDMSDEDFAVLADDLRTWLGQVIARHGVESALILYPENPRAQELFEAIEAIGLAFLPEREGCVGQVRDWAFQVFVREPTPAQRTYLAGLLNTAFYMTVLTLDADASQLVQDRVKGHRIYMDTNFIYALLGLSGTAIEALSAARLLELTKDLGYQLAVTQWTVDELRTSLRAAERRLHRLPLPRQDLAELMTMKAGESAITKAYWMKYRQTGIRPKDFFEFYSHVETLLEEYGVELVTEGCVAVDQNRQAIDEQLVLLDRFLGTRDKNELLKEHDVKHRLLIEKLRGDGNLSFSNARYWFLTRDSMLPRYGMATIDGGHVDLPFCVATSAWVQVMRAFVPRTENFDQSLVELLATPYLRYRGGPGVSAKVVDAVVGRVDAYKGATPKLAAEVLADTALVERIARAGSEEEQEQQVENAFIVKSEELRDRAEASERRENEQRTQRQAAEEVARRAQKDTDDLRSRLDQLERRQEEERVRREHERAAAEARALAEQRAREEELASEHAAQLAAANRARETAEQERKDAANRAADERRRRETAERLLRLLGTSALIVVAVVLVAIAIVASVGSAAVCALLSAAALALCAVAPLALGRQRGTKLVSFVFGFSGIVGLIVALVISR